jgi:hypothetical protein
MDDEMTDAVDTFLTYGFKSARAKNDAIQVLRALLYENYLWERDLAIHQLPRLPHIVSSLRALPQTEQKSGAWYHEGKDLLTGHEFGTVCYGGAKTREAVVRKKCTQQAVDETVTVMSPTVFQAGEDGRLSAFKWGWRYEPVIRDVFEYVVAGGAVYDGLGRIRHPTLPRLAASPDGLITDGPKCGRLVEIKAPISRVLTGSVPIDYWCQMQLQAEVCNAEAVEYVEARIGSSPTGPTAAQWAAARLGVLGVLFVVSPTPESSPQEYVYKYSPVFTEVASCLAYLPELEEGASLVETCFWWIEGWFTKTVLRNRRWWAAVGQPAYEAFWREVDSARAEGRYQSGHGFVVEPDAMPATVEAVAGAGLEAPLAGAGLEAPLAGAPPSDLPSAHGFIVEEAL